MKGTEYRCPACGAVYVSPVDLVEPPLCSNAGRHRPATMKEQKQEVSK